MADQRGRGGRVAAHRDRSPSRPATQASASASRLSSCSCVTLTCSIRLPRGDQLVQRGRVRGAPAIASRSARSLNICASSERICRCCSVACSGTSSTKSRLHRLAVGRVERDRLRQAHERAERVLQALDAAVRDRDALAEAGRAEPLAREQAVEDEAAGDAVVVLEQQARPARTGASCSSPAGRAATLAGGSSLAMRFMGRRPCGGAAEGADYSPCAAAPRLGARRRQTLSVPLGASCALASRLPLCFSTWRSSLSASEVDRRVQVGILAVAVDVLAAHVQRHLGLLLQLVHRQDHVGVDHVVEVARDARRACPARSCGWPA